MLSIKTFALFTLLVSARVSESADSVSASADSRCSEQVTICPEDLYLAIYPETPSYAAATAVNLGTAGGYAILAKAGVTTTGTTNVTGDIGVSPIAESSMTGFAQASGQNGGGSTSDLVTGFIYAADQIPPIPAKMTTAIGDMMTAYAEAAGAASATGTHTVVNHKNDEVLGPGADYYMDNEVLGPGYYKWDGDVTVNANQKITFSGNASDIWILQIAGNIKLGADAEVVLQGGAQAKNIFWQTAKAVTVGADATVNGVFLGKTRMDFQAGSRLSGAALAQTAVTMIATTITKNTTETSRRLKNLRA